MNPPAPENSLQARVVFGVQTGLFCVRYHILALSSIKCKEIGIRPTVDFVNVILKSNKVLRYIYDSVQEDIISVKRSASSITKGDFRKIVDVDQEE